MEETVMEILVQLDVFRRWRSMKSNGFCFCQHIRWISCHSILSWSLGRILADLLEQNTACTYSLLVGSHESLFQELKQMSTREESWPSGSIAICGFWHIQSAAIYPQLECPNRSCACLVRFGPCRSAIRLELNICCNSTSVRRDRTEIISIRGTEKKSSSELWVLTCWVFTPDSLMASLGRIEDPLRALCQSLYRTLWHILSSSSDEGHLF